MIEFIKKNVKRIMLVVAFILLTSLLIKYFNNKINNIKEEVRLEKIKNAKLVKEGNNLYSKIIADSLSKNQLRKINDSLKLKLKNPLIITNTIIKFKDKQEGAVSDILIKEDSLLIFTDYYPSKKEEFVRYNAKVNKINNSVIGKFDFKKINISLGIQDNKDGTFSVKTKVPKFMEVEDIVSNAIPMRKEKKDNFGFLVGGGLNSGANNNSISVLGGIRVYKYNILGEVNSTGSLGLKVLIEF